VSAPTPEGYHEPGHGFPRPPDFLSKAVSLDDAARIGSVYRLFEELAADLDELLPSGRHRALCFTALEEAAMWATKSIAHQQDIRPVNEEPDDG
jgi:hypothetical protein